MPKIIRHRIQKDRNGMRVGGAEAIVFVALIAAAIAGVRYYFTVHIKSPGYALSKFIGAVKAGDPEAQFALIDDADKRAFFTTASAYEKALPYAHGYASRIESWSIVSEKPDPKDPSAISISLTMGVRGGAKGQQLYQSSSQSLDDVYVLRKDAQGAWKVLLSRSKKQLTTISPTPPGDPITGG